MSAKKQILNLIETAKTQFIHPSIIESMLIDARCRKYLAQNKDKLMQVKLIYQDSVASVVNQIMWSSRNAFIELDKLANYDDGDAKPDSHKKIIALHNSLKNFVIKDVVQYIDIDQRTLAMERWIYIMTKLEIFGDYNSYVAVAGAVSEIAHYLRATTLGLSLKANLYLYEQATHTLGLFAGSRVKEFNQKTNINISIPYYGDYRSILLNISESNKINVSKIEEDSKNNKLSDNDYNIKIQQEQRCYEELQDEYIHQLSSLQDMQRYMYEDAAFTDDGSRINFIIDNKDIDVVSVCRKVENKMSDGDAKYNKSDFFDDINFQDVIFDQSWQFQYSDILIFADMMLKRSHVLKKIYHNLKLVFDASKASPIEVAQKYLDHQVQLKRLEVGYATLSLIVKNMREYLKNSHLVKSSDLYVKLRVIENNLLAKPLNEREVVAEIERQAAEAARQAYHGSMEITFAVQAKNNANAARENLKKSEILKFIQLHQAESLKMQDMILKLKGRKLDNSKIVKNSKRVLTPIPDVNTINDAIYILQMDAANSLLKNAHNIYKLYSLLKMEFSISEPNKKDKIQYYIKHEHHINALSASYADFIKQLEPLKRYIREYHVDDRDALSQLIREMESYLYIDHQAKSQTPKSSNMIQFFINETRQDIDRLRSVMKQLKSSTDSKGLDKNPNGFFHTGEHDALENSETASEIQTTNLTSK